MDSWQDDTPLTPMERESLLWAVSSDNQCTEGYFWKVSTCPRKRRARKIGFTTAESLLSMTQNGQILSNTFIHVIWLWLLCLLFAVNPGDIISPILQIMPLKTHCFWWRISFCFSGVCWRWLLVPMGGRDTAVTVMGRPQGPQGQAWDDSVFLVGLFWGSVQSFYLKHFLFYIGI